MSAIFFLIACSVTLALIFLGAFFWAHHHGQNDDLYTPSVRMLLDEEDKAKEWEDEIRETEADK
ncbi:MAG: cbb3-type cytochrome oxidase assembly protein CcoS [Sphingobacteriales bacterium]|nr:cbb3-type cytochrome oxidase assembly protein CcoS [Sphingobacteriales bacterium]